MDVNDLKGVYINHTEYWPMCENRVDMVELIKREIEWSIAIIDWRREMIKLTGENE